MAAKTRDGSSANRSPKAWRAESAVCACSVYVTGYRLIRRGAAESVSQKLHGITPRVCSSQREQSPPMLKGGETHGKAHRQYGIMSQVPVRMRGWQSHACVVCVRARVCSAQQQVNVCGSEKAQAARPWAGPPASQYCSGMEEVNVA